jgi:hypothetical protein
VTYLPFICERHNGIGIEPMPAVDSFGERTMPDKSDVAQSKHNADTPRPRLGWLAHFQAPVIENNIAMSRLARH